MTKFTNSRGLTPARLKALTVIFNYNHYRMNGKTPAEKLFKTSFPNLFEWMSEQIVHWEQYHQNDTIPHLREI